MKTNFYIDGFNLYYGAAKDHPELKWLDFGGFCQAFLPRGGELGESTTSLP